MTPMPLRRPLLVLLLLLPLTEVAPAFWLRAFSWPAAWLAARFLGAPCWRTAEGGVIATDPVPVLVTTACSGAAFFVITAALLAGTLDGARRRPLAATLGLAAGAAYAVTILANTARIVLASMAAAWARTALPPPYWSGLHMGVGIFVFMTALIAVHAAALWRNRHAHA